MFDYTAASDGSGAGILLLLFVIVGALLYFLPTIIAFKRRVPNVGSVAVINTFLGWSLIGWVVSLAMASRSSQPTVVINQLMPSSTAMHPDPRLAPSAGWFPDPAGDPGLERYYDGRQWTPNTRPALP